MKWKLFDNENQEIKFIKIEAKDVQILKSFESSMSQADSIKF